MLNDNNNKSLVSTSDNIFNKIKRLFKSIFREKTEYSYEMNVIQNRDENNEKIKNSIFADAIKTEESIEQRLIRLQRMIREKRITEDELSNEDKLELRNLYKMQIDELRNSILQKRSKIMKIRYEKKRKAHASI